MKLLSSAITACRSYSTKGTKCSQTRFKNKNQIRKYDPTSPKSTRIKWTDQQTQILADISEGKSVFITGSGGTGKTLLVEHIIKQLKKIHGSSKVAVTASTGVAACAIRGQTLHSFAGIGLGDADHQTLLERVVSDKRAHRRWKKVKALVIDECSMISPDHFDSLEYIARNVRDNKGAKWGGLQLIVSGDFFQLPPIKKKLCAVYRKKKGNQKHVNKKKFAFEADCWNSSFDKHVELTTVFRQSQANFIKLLQGMRKGESDMEDYQLLEKLCSGKEPGPSVVRIYPMKEDVSRVNTKQMASLGQKTVVYHALDSGEDHWKWQLKQGIAPDQLEICVGARVMLIKNFNPWQKLVNGATGTVIKFQKSDALELPVVKFDSGIERMMDLETWVVLDGEKAVATRKQIPLILAWALSIHKCQGMTLDSLYTDLSRTFDFGMVYVALSRVRNLDGLHLSGFKPSKIKAHPKVLQFYQNFTGEHDKQGEEQVVKKSGSSPGSLAGIGENVVHKKGSCLRNQADIADKISIVQKHEHAKQGREKVVSKNRSSPSNFRGVADDVFVTRKYEPANEGEKNIVSKKKSSPSNLASVADRSSFIRKFEHDKQGDKEVSNKNRSGDSHLRGSAVMIAIVRNILNALIAKGSQ
ncbi:hypothetical protein RJ640_001199 [Escallonia rubra]|uniref:ATP-dependent DNA helicase n=1 Tax=Escallonia rubra TaxID=112253 RepID=A0AA88RD71_9ASTE|nr:hypothetical protein RJ640_001199 [Escallonia rubra]